MNLDVLVVRGIDNTQTERSMFGGVCVKLIIYFVGQASLSQELLKSSLSSAGPKLCEPSPPN